MGVIRYAVDHGGRECEINNNNNQNNDDGDDNNNNNSNNSNNNTTIYEASYHGESHYKGAVCVALNASLCVDTLTVYVMCGIFWRKLWLHCMNVIEESARFETTS